MANVGANNVHVQIAAAIAAGDTPSHITMDGMTNDMHQREDGSYIQLGAISEGYSATLDESTFCGGLESALKKLILNFMGATIVYVRAHNMSSRDATKQAVWGEKALEICRKWGVRYVDVYSRGMNTNIPEVRLAYTLIDESHPTGDGTHPITAFYKKDYVPPLEAALAGAA